MTERPTKSNNLQVYLILTILGGLWKYFHRKISISSLIVRFVHKSEYYLDMRQGYVIRWV